MVRHLIKITTATEEMALIAKPTKAPTLTTHKTYTETSFTEYTPTGFGQLPVPRTHIPKTFLQSSRLLTSLLSIALILCLCGVIYLLLFVTLISKI